MEVIVLQPHKEKAAMELLREKVQTILLDEMLGVVVIFHHMIKMQITTFISNINKLEIVRLCLIKMQPERNDQKWSIINLQPHRIYTRQILQDQPLLEAVAVVLDLVVIAVAAIPIVREMTFTTDILHLPCQEKLHPNKFLLHLQPIHLHP